MAGIFGAGVSIYLSKAVSIYLSAIDKADYPLGIPRKITFKNSSSRLHPMHIHGVFFRVLERDGRKAVEQFTRDTVLVGPRESVTIGFVPEHPGIWLTHCHILSHAEAGMMTTIEVKK